MHTDSLKINTKKRKIIHFSLLYSIRPSTKTKLPYHIKLAKKYRRQTETSDKWDNDFSIYS